MLIFYRRATKEHRKVLDVSESEMDGFMPFRICVRKRPLLNFEREREELDVVHVHGHQRTHASLLLAKHTAIVCHESKVHRSGRRLSVCHHQQPVHR